MRISDWSSDVCSSDLAGAAPPVADRRATGGRAGRASHLPSRHARGPPAARIAAHRRATLGGTRQVVPGGKDWRSGRGPVGALVRTGERAPRARRTCARFYAGAVASGTPPSVGKTGSGHPARRRTPLELGETGTAWCGARGGREVEISEGAVT